MPAPYQRTQTIAVRHQKATIRDGLDILSVILGCQLGIHAQSKGLQRGAVLGRGVARGGAGLQSHPTPLATIALAAS